MKVKVVIAVVIDERMPNGIAAEGPDIMVVGSWSTENPQKKRAAKTLRPLVDSH
jgi:hypothetical protein